MTDEYIEAQKSKLRLAVKTSDATELADASDRLRDCGFTYRAQLEVAREEVPELTEAEWESLMQEAEEAGES